MIQTPLQFLGATKLELGPVSEIHIDAHWRQGVDAHGVAWLALDKRGSSANTLSTDVLNELNERLDQIESDRPEALVIRSAKMPGFIAGADVTQFVGMTDQAVVRTQLHKSHKVLDRLADMSYPTIAVVHGYALGAGFELALACDYRVAIEGASFGFPEVLLGLHPGMGGTFRLTRQIDPIVAMTMMLTGKRAHTERASELGIVDVITQERHLANAIAAIVAGDVKRHEPGLKNSAFTLAPARAVAARQMRAKAESKAPQEHYPAPHALIELWEEHGADQRAMQSAEMESFATLLAGSSAQNLIRVYSLREKLKRLGDERAVQDGISHVHVIGAGAMGTEIAAWCALKGLRVTLNDLDMASLASAVGKARKLCEDRHLTDINTRDVLDRLIPDPDGNGVRHADLVIEAVSEKIELKRKIYADLQDSLKPGAVLVSNTSSIELTQLTQGLANPSHFAGLHFFNPVSRLELIEVVSHPGSDEQVLARLRAFVTRIDRLPAPVRSYPGFLVNRVLMPYLMEALVLLDEGLDKTLIDGAATRFGMPMGPLEVADRVGLDVCLHVAQSLRESLQKPMPEIPDWFLEMIDRGELGRKTGKGFYQWSDGKTQNETSKHEPSLPEDTTDRLILPMLDACVECLRRNVVSDEDTLDGAIIFGTGFAPFRGGPMTYARARGTEQVADRLRELAARHGDRFAPDPDWGELTNEAETARTA